MKQRPTMPMYHWAEYASICQCYSESQNMWNSQVLLITARHDYTQIATETWAARGGEAITIFNTFHHLNSLGF